VETEQDFLATARLFKALDINVGWQSEAVKKREATDRYGDLDKGCGEYEQRSPEVIGIFSSTSL